VSDKSLSDRLLENEWYFDYEDDLRDLLKEVRKLEIECLEYERAYINEVAANVFLQEKITTLQKTIVRMSQLGGAA